MCHTTPFHVTPSEAYPKQAIIYTTPCNKAGATVASRVTAASVLNGHNEIHANTKSP
jgi:hypothetical protein